MPDDEDFITIHSPYNCDEYCYPISQSPFSRQYPEKPIDNDPLPFLDIDKKDR